MYNFDKIHDRASSQCYKYNALKMVYGRDDLIPLWVADMEFGIAPEIEQAIQERVAHPIFGYNFPNPDFYESFINYVDKNHHWKLNSEWLQMSPGIVPAINFFVDMFTEVGENIVIQEPVYPPFHEAVVSHDRTLLINNLQEENNNYSIDFTDLEENLKEAKMFIFCSPHNPLGKVWSRDDLLKIGRLCKKHDVLLVCDEIHNDLVYKEHNHIPIAMLEDFSDFTITLMAPSKTFNIAGLQSSVMIAPNKVIKDRLFEYFFKYHIFGSNSVGNSAFQAAYKVGEPWLKELMAYLEESADYLVKRVNAMKYISVKKPEATFLAWINFKDTGLNDEELANFCKNRAGLALNAGLAFGEAGSGYMRLNFGCQRELLVKALDQLEDALNTLEQDRIKN